MALQMAVGAAVLFSLGRPAIELGIAILVIVGIYPFMKRITYWPQVFLGICFNWGALVAWAAATHRVEAPALALYIGGLFWTLGYDTIYAHADTADDLAIGVKSTALRLGESSRVWIGGFYGVALVCFAAALRLAGAGWPGFVGLGLLGAHFLWQIAVWRMADPAHCIAIFRSNRTAGLILVFACMATGLGFV
jgi:4-hydroxybenzoate polyprenyltransferase